MTKPMVWETNDCETLQAKSIFLPLLIKRYIRFSKRRLAISPLIGQN
jgi:hypothetical protein